MWRLLPVLVALLLALPVSAGSAPSRFGPKPYSRSTETPVTVTEQFSVCRPDRAFHLRLENGANGGARVSSASIMLNGVEVVREQDLNQEVGSIQVPVSLASENTLAIRLAGQPGGSVLLTIGSQAACLEVNLTAPAPGASVPAGPLIVRGTVHGAPEAGVTVNGIPAFVEGEEFVGLVRLEPEERDLVGVATALDGSTAESRQSIVVLPAADDGALSFSAVRPGGFAPLTTGFVISSHLGVRDVAVDADADGTVDLRGADLDGREFAYVRRGVYVASAEITDTMNQGHRVFTFVHVHDPAALDARLQPVWLGLKDALRSGDVARALTFIHTDGRERYGELFNELNRRSPAALANIDRHMTSIRLIEAGFGGAKYEMERTEDGKVYVFSVWFQLDVDGVWRLRRY